MLFRSSVIGHVTSGNLMHVKKGKKTFANISTEIVANAHLLDRPSKKPAYLKIIQNEKKLKPILNHSKTM